VTSIAARCRFLLTGAATVAATVLVAAPATASVTAAAGCPDRAVTQPFAPWSDGADYFLAPDGGFEQDAAGWTLRGRASVVDGNEPFAVAAPSDSKSLRLPAGSSATTAPFCIGVEHRSIRFFGDAAATSVLNVDAVIEAPGESERAVRIATVNGADRWAPSDVIAMAVNELAVDQGNAINVRLRFAPHGAGSWTIDDVFVDPYSRG
jgi:hypothetical protein